MKSEILTIGDEILIGQITDTNSAWIASRLNDAGVTVMRKVSVGDRREEIRQAVEDALDAVDIVVVTGGLGPTRDDITKEVLTEVFGGGMVRDAETFERNRQILSARGIDYNELNRSQADVPERATVLPNLHGTAPGLWFERGGRILVALPGVPFEMKQLVDKEVMPRLSERFALNTVTHRTAITFGLAESVLAAKIAAWEDRLPSYLRLAYLPSTMMIRLRLSSYDEDRTRAQRDIETAFMELERLIPENFVGYGEDTLFSETARMLTERGETLAIAESCTGGALSSSYTMQEGASKYLKGSVTAYSNEVKAQVLGVRGETLEEYGAVSEQTACEMAEGVRRLLGADYGMSTTGYAGPQGGDGSNPVGTVWVGLSTAAGTEAKRYVFGSLRAQNIERASANAANMLRLKLKGLA